MESEMTYKNYKGSVEHSEEDKCYFGKVLDIRCLYSYEGDTLDELRRGFEEAVDTYLTDCAERGIESESYDNVTDVCKIPNAETLEAFKELEEVKKNPSSYKSYTSAEELMEDLSKDDETDASESI